MDENSPALPGNLQNPRQSERFVISRTQSGRNLVRRKPIIQSSRAGLSTSTQQEIRQAVTYAEFAYDQAYDQALYQSRAVGTSNTAYNLAVVDALGKPQVLHVDINGWTGKIGQTVLIKARDNFMVLSVRLVIREGDKSLEEGEAEQSQSDGLIWKYTLKRPVERKTGLILDAYAYDLRGNVGKYSIEVK